MGAIRAKYWTSLPKHPSFKKGRWRARSCRAGSFPESRSMEIDAASSAISGALRPLLSRRLTTHHASGGGYLLQKSVTPGIVREIVRRHAGEADCQFVEGGA